MAGAEQVMPSGASASGCVVLVQFVHALLVGVLLAQPSPRALRAPGASSGVPLASCLTCVLYFATRGSLWSIRCEGENFVFVGLLPLLLWTAGAELAVARISTGRLASIP